MLISAQEQELCSSLRDFPEECQNQWTPEAGRRFVQLLFRSLVGNNQDYLKILFNHKVPRDTQDWSLREAQGSTEGSEYTENARGKPCGHIFKSGEATYRCKTCTIDDTCVLCSRCYESSDHTDHMVFVNISPGNSGCCDCGDIEAWRRPVNCAIHSHQELSESQGKQKEPMNIPEDLAESIRMTIGRAFDYMCDVISCSPEQLRLPKSENSIKEDELSSRLAAKWYGESSTPDKDTEYALVLWNDEKHSMQEVTNQVARACKKEMSFGQEKARETDDIGRSVVTYGKDLELLLKQATIIEKIKITVTIRSARDTFREQMCSAIIEWLLDISGCAVGADGDILKQTVCKEMLKPWRAGSKASHAYIGKDGIDDHEIDESMREREMYSGRNIHDIQVQPNGGIAVTVIQRNNQGQREERDDNGEDEDDTRSREGETDDLMDLDIDLGSSDADGDLDMRTTADHEPDDDLEVSEATLAGYPPPPPPPAGRNPALPRITPASSDAIGSAQTTPKAVVPVPKTPWSHNRSAHSRPPPKYWIESLEETQPANVPLAEDIRQRVRLDWLILFDLRLWKKARVDLRDLYISTVVTVPEFKRILGLRFAGLYTVLAQLYLIADREPDHSIIYLSLQMLTTPSITLEVIEKGNFLTNLIAILYTFLTTRQVGHPGDVDASATLAFDTGSVTNRRMYHFFMDLKHLFQSEFVQEKLREDERYVLQFLDLIKLPQGICPNVRAVGEHVEYETDTWISASLLTRELNRLCRQFAEAFKWSGGENYHSICSVMRIIAKATVINSIGVERKLFDQAEIKDETRFKHMSGLGFELEAAGMSSDPEMYDIVDFAVETEPISFHHALHYILSWLVDCAKSMPPDEVRRLLTFTAEEIHDAAPFAQYRTVAPAYPPETYLMALFDFPLRVCAWLAQMKAGMWVRNGLSLRHQMSTYRGVQQRDLAHQRDIFLLQTAMVVCNPSRVLLSIIDRFGMLGWMAGNFPVRDKGENDEATQMLDVAEDFIHLLIVILIERTSLQPPEDEPSPQSLAIRRDITHILCFKPLSFSDLCNRLVDKFQDLDEFQEILEEMATFRSPEGLSDTGTFELKSEYLAEIDPYILHYTKNQRDEAEAVYRNWVSKKTGKPAADVVMEPKLRTIKSGLFQDLAAFTRTDIFAQVVLNSLRWALTAGQHSPNTQSTRVEAFLMVVLHLILAAIFEDQSNDDAYDSQSQKSFVRRILFKGSIEQDSIFLSLHSLLIRDDLSACHPKTRKILARLEQKCPQSVARVTEARGVSMVKGGADTPLTASVEELEAKKKAALDRQAKVLASFQKQQEAFLNNQNDIDWGEDEDYDESESVAMSQEEHKKFWKYPDGNCILCQEETNDNRLYGTFGLLGESRILRQTDMDDSDYLREVLDTPSSLDRSAERIRPFGVGGQNHFPVKKLASDGTEITSERQGLGKGFQALDCRAGPISVGCGHIMHFACFELYLSATSRRQAHQIARNHPEKLEMMEFVCPLCKALGNTFLPIIWKGKEESYPGVLETEVSFTEWIDSQIGLLASRYLKFPAERSGTNARQQEVFANTLASTFLAPSSGVAAVNRAATDPGPVTPLRWVFNMMPGTFPDEDGATAASSSEAYLIEELMSIYSRVKETIKKNQLRSRFPYTTYENASNVPDLVYIDILANAVGCSIAATEAAYRGVESDAGCLLLDKIPSITLTHLRILSESASSYIAMGASRAQGASRANLEFTQMQKDQLVQLFAGHPQIFEELPWGRQGDQVMRLPAALAGDPFLLLAEASVCLVPALRIDIHHVVQLCFLMELVKVILTIHCNAKIIPLLPQMSIPNNKAAEISPDSVNELRRFLDYLEICGDLNTKLSRCDVEVLRRLHLLISTYAQTFLRKAAILLNVRYGVDFPNTGYGDMDQPELARLSRAMRMPQLIEVFGIVSQDPEQGGNGNLRSIVRAWITHWRLMTRHGTGLSDAAFKGIRPSHPAIFELVGLPKYYDTLLDEMMRRRCPTTKKELMEPAICLFCGDIFCSQAVCCSVDGLGGCNQHMKK